MSDKERPLPKPPRTAFGRKRIEEQGDAAASLLSDRMAQAAAEGKLDEFLKEEMPDNEYARNLASMMMGMTGMMPVPGPAQPSLSEKPADSEDPGPEGAEAAAPEVPGEVRAAIAGGDVQTLMKLLRQEHAKRNPDSANRASEAPASSPAQGTEKPVIDREIIDALVRIAAENSVTLDWTIFRAIKLYVQEYEKTGRL